MYFLGAMILSLHLQPLDRQRCQGLHNHSVIHGKHLAPKATIHNFGDVPLSYSIQTPIHSADSHYTDSNFPTLLSKEALQTF